ncbi:hypothetical protein [Kaistia sp. MMO-174]|uniref:hypothetical protein n=1 Tax=Kaistia sp. MMO-174 TaxID=3081256 RepID=UPI003017A353
MFQAVVEWALDRFLVVQLDIRDRGWIGWVLLAIGIGVAWLGATDQRKGAIGMRIFDPIGRVDRELADHVVGGFGYPERRLAYSATDGDSW